MATPRLMASSGIRHEASRQRVIVFGVDWKPKHARKSGSQVSLYVHKRLGCRRTNRIEPEVSQTLVVCAKRITECGRLHVEFCYVVRPIAFWRRSKYRERLHSGPQVRSGIASPTEEIALRLIEK